MSTNDALFQAERWAIVAQLKQTVIDKEIELGLSVEGATRPLFSHELDAEIRFAEIDDVDARATRDAEAEITAIQAAVSAGILAALFARRKVLSPRDLADAVANLDVEGMPDAVRDRAIDGRTRLAGIMANVYERSSEVAIGEAIRQGLEVDLDPLKIDADEFLPLATSAAVEPWNRSLAVVHANHLTPEGILKGSVTRETVRDTIDAAGTASAVDKAHQGILAAAGSGRVATGSRLNPTAVWASELLDGATCDRCGSIDGKRYETIEDAREDYPNGGYRLCRGGPRCRGTLVYKY